MIEQVIIPDAVDLIMMLFENRDFRIVKNSNAIPVLDLCDDIPSSIRYRIYVDKNGYVKISPYNGWITLGNIHESDILDRIKNCI